MARQINVHIEIEGGKEISRHLGLVIEQELFDHHRFELNVPFEQLEDSGDHFFNRSHRDVMGKKITFSFSPRRSQDTFEFVFQGIVTEIRLQSLSDMNSAFVLKGFGTSILLEDAVQRRSFLRGTVQELFNKVLEPYPQNVLRRSLSPNNGTRRVPFIQYNESNYRFLSRVADRCGEWFYYDGQVLVLGQPGNPPEADFVVDGRQNFDIAMVLRPAVFKMEGYDYTEHQSFIGESSAQQVEGLTILSEFALNESDNVFAQPSLAPFSETVGGQSEADELAKAERSARSTSMIDFKGRGDMPTISVGTILNVKGNRINLEGRRYEESFGKYRVTSVRHSVNTAGSYTNTFEAVTESSRHPPRNTRVQNPLGETELAEVIANDDPDSLGRIRVKFRWGQAQQQEQESYWIRVSSFHSSEGRGANFVPEVGAQVMIAYELNLAELPFVSGCLYPKPQGSVNYSPTDNNLKIIATRSGNYIVFDDKEGEAQIRITNNNKTHTHIILDFKDDGRIAISATDGIIEVKSKRLVLKASEDMQLKAGNNLEIEAKEIKVKADQNFSLEAVQNVELKATSEIKMEGTTGVKLKGAQLEAEADAMAKISSSGVLTIKGSLVQIN